MLCTRKCSPIIEGSHVLDSLGKCTLGQECQTRFFRELHPATELVPDPTHLIQIPEFPPIAF